jgi:hypothetical protein
MSIKYCPTGEILADFMMKTLQEKLFAKFKKLLMGALQINARNSSW